MTTRSMLIPVLTLLVLCTALPAGASATPAALGEVVEPAGMPPGGFLDVSSGHWAYGEIMACVDAGIVAGYDDGTYRPDWPVTRDQMAVYIARALAGGKDNVPAGPSEATFEDVPLGYWAYDQVEYCYDQKVVQGYTPTIYGPTDQVTREQMAVYVARALVAPTGDAVLEDYVPSNPRNFPDVASDSWAYKHVEFCVEHGVVNGYTDGKYYPLTVVTRDQMAVFVQRAFQLPIPAGPPAPDFTLQTLDGTQEYRLSDLKGTALALFFWTSWCPYSQDQAIDLETLYQRYQDQDFLVLGVGLDDPVALQDEVDLLGLTFPVGYNPGAGDLYGVEYVPYTFIVDRSGCISSSWLGSQYLDTLDAAIQEVL